MMTDINMWSVGLTSQLVTTWMTCQDDPRLEENKIVDWLTANWTLEGVDVESIPKNNICWKAEKEKNFLGSVVCASLTFSYVNNLRISMYKDF